MTARRLTAAVLLACALLGAPSPIFTAEPAAQQPDADEVRIRALLQRVEQAALRADPAAYLALLAGTANRNSTTQFLADEFRPGANRVMIQERYRQALAGTLPGTGYSLTVDAFMEYGSRGRVATWQIDIKRVDEEWRIAGQERISSVENLYRLSLNLQKQYEAHNFTIVAEDLELRLADGSVFVVETDQGVTGLILLGRGDMRFHPAPDTEKGQVKIFAGSDTVESRFDAAFIRVGSFEAHADPNALKPRPVDPREVRRAEQVFREESGKSFVIDLADLTRDTWSLLPGPDDFLAEVRTRRYDTLTYARSASEAEDISFFDRRHKRNISIYPSKDKLASRGRFYNEDDLAPYDVLDYDIDIVSTPERQWIEGKATMRLRVRAPSLGQLTIRLADSLVVRSVVSERYGRLFHLRVSNQNTILVNLPVTLLQDSEMAVTIEYGGRLEPQEPERETIAVGGQRTAQDPSPSNLEDPFFPRPEASYLYSNRSFWYPQGLVSDYATATIQISVPSYYSCVASGEPSSDSPRTVAVPGRDAAQTRKIYNFTAERPLRYLGFLVARLARADRWTVAFDANAAAGSGSSLAKDAPELSGAVYNKLDLIVEANPRQAGRGKELAERSVDIIQFYESIVGDSPYSTFTVALLESMLPGGHSPGYFAVVNQPLPGTGVSWRNDPASFASYPEFFLAHEIAHQWWGQAVGWRNYHEQWLSEGFAQYFAALYAQKLRGDDVFSNVLRQMRKWGIDDSDQGPVFLGYRIGHIKNEGRAFRAIVYNKGAVVLHMLRRLVGDEAFFKGLRRFYVESRFTKVGTDDLRQAMEAEWGKPLDRFFERWIYGSTLPRITMSYRIETGAGGRSGHQLALHFEQSGDIFDLPVSLTIDYSDRKPVNILVPVTEKVVDWRVPLEGTFRSVDLNRDDGTLAELVKN